MWFFTACLNGACAVVRGKKKKTKKRETVHADTKQKRRCKLLIGGVRSFFLSASFHKTWNCLCWSECCVGSIEKKKKVSLVLVLDQALHEPVLSFTPVDSQSLGLNIPTECCCFLSSSLNWPTSIFEERQTPVLRQTKLPRPVCSTWETLHLSRSPFKISPNTKPVTLHNVQWEECRQFLDLERK